MAISENESSRLKARARRKFVGQKIARELLKTNSPILGHKYKYTFGCCHKLFSDGKVLKSDYYCGNRWCPTCQAITMGKLINRYSETLERIHNKHGLYFVTLTSKTVPGRELKQRFNEFNKTWRKITDMARKTRNGFNGIRKIECKSSASIPGHYHLHYHILIQGGENAEWLRAQWLKKMPDAHERGQDVRRVDALDAGVLELFKYTVKLTTSTKKGEKPMTGHQLNTIFEVFYRRRIYQAFGNLRAVREEFTPPEDDTIEVTPGVYIWVDSDWVHRDFGVVLSGYVPTEEELLE